MLAIDGVFPAVKCAICSTVYDAGNDDFVAFWGPVTAGLERDVLSWTPPSKPKRRAINVICRTPECQLALVRRMLRCDPSEEGTPDALWRQVLTIWAADQGLEVVEPGAPEPEKPSKTRRRR